MKALAFFMIALVSLLGCTQRQDTTLRGDSLRSFVVEAGAVMRSADYDSSAAMIERYLSGARPPQDHLDTVRTAYLYAHLARSYWFLDDYRGVVRAYERGDVLLSFIPDTLQIRILRGAATAYAAIGDYDEGERLALNATVIAWNKGYMQAHIDAWLCWHKINRERQGLPPDSLSITILVVLIIGLFELLLVFLFLRPVKSYLRYRINRPLSPVKSCLHQYPHQDV